MKTLALVLAIAFLVVSFGFFDGWPFRSQTTAPSETESEADPGDQRVLVDLVKEQPKAQISDQVDGPLPASPEVDRAKVLEAQENLVTARSEGLEARLIALSELILRFEMPADLRNKARQELQELQREQVWRGAKGLAGAERVVVARGDNLTRIARRSNKEKGGNVSPALVIKLNGLRNDRIRSGQSLMVPSGELKVLISKRDYRAYLLLEGIIVADYPVGLGRNDATPLGQFKIVGKTVNPAWTMPDGRIVPFGHPEHIIGSRWLGFADEKGPTSYGIHGTVDDASIGKNESDGCVRMLKADVEELFELVPEGCGVEVVP